MTMKKRILAALLAVGVVTAAVPSVGAMAVDAEGNDSYGQESVSADGGLVSEVASVERGGGGSRAIPQGSYGINLNVNGRQVL